MRVLVTGGTGVVGIGTVTELLARGHSVVLFSRNAETDARQWVSGVIPIEGDVADSDSVTGSATGCACVLHMVGIVGETADATYESVNVQGTAHIVAEAERAGVPRLVFVSSLGAPEGESDYHRSKAKAESIVRQFDGAWTICRPGNVYGPGDEQISQLLRMVRGVSPVLPVIGDGDQPFQPIWWEDVARAIAEIVERSDLDRRELDLAGPDLTSQNDLIKRLKALTGRDVMSVPVPGFLASAGAKALSLVGWDVGLNESQLTMLTEGNVIADGGVNALTEVLSVLPTKLGDGLRMLADQQPEQLPDEGIGEVRRKRYWADIAGHRCTAESLFEEFRQGFNEVTPQFVEAGAEPGTTSELTEGATVTLALPLRGHVQVRVAALESRRATLVTLAGHPLAGAVRFLCEPRGTDLRFQVEVYERAATVLDLVAMRTIGDRLQDHTWEQVVVNMEKRSGGTAQAGVQREQEALTEQEATELTAWLKEITVRRKREENAETIAGGSA